MISGLPGTMKKKTPPTSKADSIDVSQSQRERLAYLEMRAWFAGEVRRPDIEARFGVKPAAASRDLTAYRDIAPDNLEYDTAARCYRPTADFNPVFGFSADRVLSWLLSGFGDGLDPRPKKPAPCEGPGNLRVPDLDILAAVSRALCTGRVLKISYLSLSSGRASRVIVPVALADTGLRWHVRAYDRQNDRFSDFALRRIAKAEILDERAGEGETLEADEQWARMTDMELVPHPDARWPEGIEADYGMEDGVLRARSRAALAGYFLHRWQVDCTPDHTLDPAEHHLWLRNPETLYGVGSAALAPGRGRDLADESKNQ
jgi:hypothetical protein